MCLHAPRAPAWRTTLPPRRICNHWKCAGSAAVLGRALATRIAARVHVARNWRQWCSCAVQLSFGGDHPYAATLVPLALMPSSGLFGGTRSNCIEVPRTCQFDFSKTLLESRSITVLIGGDACNFRRPAGKLCSARRRTPHAGMRMLPRPTPIRGLSVCFRK